MIRIDEVRRPELRLEEDVVQLGGPEARHVLFATAELSPLCRVGGLADASSGMVAALRRAGCRVTVVVPDYDGTPAMVEERSETLQVPAWAGPASVRYGTVAGVGEVAVVRTRGIERPHPYNHPVSGQGWEDNDVRFLGFSAAVAELARRVRPDVVHLNDWHTAAATAWLSSGTPVVLTVHNLAYQGSCGRRWLDRMGDRWVEFSRHGSCNPLAGGIALADRVVAVSPAYAAETRRPGHGVGLDELLRSKGRDYLGIRNGIDAERWDPSTDPLLPANFTAFDLAGKAQCRTELLRAAGLPDVAGEPVIGMVCRFVEQTTKGFMWRDIGLGDWLFDLDRPEAEDRRFDRRPCMMPERGAQPRIVGVGAPARHPCEVLGDRQLGHVRYEPRGERQLAERAR